MPSNHPDVILSFDCHSFTRVSFRQPYFMATKYSHSGIISLISQSFEHRNDMKWHLVGMTGVTSEWQFESSRAHSVIRDLGRKCGISWFHPCHLMSSRHSAVIRKVRFNVNDLGMTENFRPNLTTFPKLVSATIKGTPDLKDWPFTS